MKKILAAVGLAIVVLVGWGTYQAITGRTVASTTSSSQKVYHVGILNALDYFGGTVDGFKHGMTSLGYVEGKNIVYDVEKGPAPVGNQKILQKFVDDKVDLILSFPTEASLEAKEVTHGTGIPVIATEPGIEDNNLVASVRHPGGNITGVRFPVPEVTAKRLEILHEIAPKAVRIWIPYLKDYPTVHIAINAIAPLIKSYGLTMIAVPFASPDELASYLKAHAAPGKEGMDAILTVPEPLAIIPAFADQITAFADAHRIPVAGAAISNDDTGPIFSLIPTSVEFGQLAAPLADKIFRGTPAGEIPIVTPESQLEINYKVIQKLGLSVSDALLSTAVKIVR